MATSYTSLLGFALPVTGELDGTWGDVVNNSITQLVEDSVAGTATASVTSGDWTLTTTGSGSANQARCAIIRPTGTPGTSRNVIAPSQSKAYIVDNQSDGSVVFKGSATTGVTIPAGKQALVAWNGSDFVQVGASAGGSDTQVQYNSSGSLAGSANLTFNGTTLTAAGFSGPINGTIGATTPSTGVFTQVDITAEGDLRLQDTTGGQYVALQAPGTITSSYTLTMPAADGTNGQAITTNGSGALSFSSVGYLNIPQSGSAKTSSYQLATADVGKFIEVGASGSITIPDATFSAGDAIAIFNNTSGNITITCSITTAYLGGTDADKATVTLATRGVANVLFISGTVCVITGNVS